VSNPVQLVLEVPLSDVQLVQTFLGQFLGLSDDVFDSFDQGTQVWDSDDRDLLDVDLVVFVRPWTRVRCPGRWGRVRVRTGQRSRDDQLGTVGTSQLVQQVVPTFHV
jgi:hypothetical protein